MFSQLPADERIKRYRQLADEADAVARRNGLEAAAYVNIASQWRKLAEEIERAIDDGSASREMEIPFAAADLP